MKSTFYPGYSGSYMPESLNEDFIWMLAARIDNGLLPKASNSRNNYEIVNVTDDSIRFRAVNFLTGINIGFNYVSIKINREAGTINYQVSFWSWARYCIFLCLGIGLALGVLFLMPLMGLYLFSRSYYPSTEEIKDYCIPMVIFWGLLWPWILIVIHKRSAEKCLVKILEEVNEDSA
tara:strand:+ start:42 stop:572 length:531 start_codon:yes stop_codon:yes gene_type:complete